MTDLPALNALIEAEAAALGFALVRVRLFGAGDDRTLQVMAERPDTRQLTIDDCAALSRRLSERLDALEAEGDDPIEGAYRLEVSSPGIDRPLTRLADFADWAGHEAKVALSAPVAGRRQLHGVLQGIDGGEVAIDDRKSGPVRFAFSVVESAKLVLTDRLIAATRPLDTSGADEFEAEDDPRDHEDESRDGEPAGPAAALTERD